VADDLARISARFESMSRPVWLWDLTRARIVWANASALRFWHAESVFDLLDYPFARNGAEATAARTPGRDIDAVLRPQGSALRARLEVAEISLGAGRPGRLVMVHAVRPLQTRIKPQADGALFREAPVGLCIVDPLGTILDVNKAGKNLTGSAASLDGLLGAAAAPRFLLHALAHGTANLSAQTPHGRLSLSGTRIKGETGDTILIKIEDVTARRALENLLTARANGARTAPASPSDQALQTRLKELEALLKEAERKSRAKTDFLNQLSHEMRNPLNAILGFSEIMEGHHFGPLGDERYESYAGDIRMSAEHLLSLVNDLLDMARIESGKMKLEFDSVALPSLIEDCVKISKAQAAKFGVNLYTLAPANLPPVVADARSLKQVLINLISNAVKFTGSGGSVLVSAEPDAEGGILITVADTGIGMSHGEVQLALEPFGQVDGKLQNRHKGTGLGLPVAKALTEANKAIFNIESEPKQGTQVKLLFPSTRVLAG